MSHIEQPDEYVSGGIANFFCSFPHWMDYDDINTAQDELGAEVRAYREPPVADLMMSSPSGEIEDHRMFYIEFSSLATDDDVAQVLGIVTNAFRRYRRTNSS